MPEAGYQIFVCGGHKLTSWCKGVSGISRLLEPRVLCYCCQQAVINKCHIKMMPQEGGDSKYQSQVSEYLRRSSK